jgi:RimJ/RimL family protein N-acetyltransferase
LIVTDDRVARFVGERVGAIICPPFTCMGIEQDGEIVVGVIFNNFNGASIEISVAGSVWTRGFIKAVGDYVFGQLKCCRMQITTEQEKIARVSERMGGKREGVLRNKFGRGRDGIVLGILDTEYRNW